MADPLLGGRGVLIQFSFPNPRVAPNLRSCGRSAHYRIPGSALFPTNPACQQYRLASAAVFSHPKGRSLAMKRALSWRAWSAWVVIGLLSTAGLGSPQSLGEVARRERERRELEGKKSKKVYTNDDFPSIAAAMEAPSSRVLAADSKEPSAKVDEAELEKQWRRRFAGARGRLHKAELD